MHPMIPPSLLIDLANERFKVKPAMNDFTTSQDPDRLFLNDASMPDPVTMALRTLFASGPLGALMRWIDRKIEAREDRRYGVATSEPDTANVTSPSFLVIDDQADRDIAA